MHEVAFAVEQDSFGGSEAVTVRPEQIKGWVEQAKALMKKPDNFQGEKKPV